MLNTQTHSKLASLALPNIFIWINIYISNVNLLTFCSFWWTILVFKRRSASLNTESNAEKEWVCEWQRGRIEESDGIREVLHQLNTLQMSERVYRFQFTGKTQKFSIKSTKVWMKFQWVVLWCTSKHLIFKMNLCTTHRMHITILKGLCMRTKVMYAWITHSSIRLKIACHFLWYQPNSIFFSTLPPASSIGIFYCDIFYFPSFF